MTILKRGVSRDRRFTCHEIQVGIHASMAGCSDVGTRTRYNRYRLTATIAVEYCFECQCQLCTRHVMSTTSL